MNSLTSKTRNLTAALLTAALLLGSSMSKAQSNPDQMIKKNKCAIGNLKSGITSWNDGLRKSSIYFAGEYRVAEVAPELTAQLKKESDPKIKILIALVLYRIGDTNGLNQVRELASKDSDPEVRRMCASIYNAYVTNSGDEIASLRY